MIVTSAASAKSTDTTHGTAASAPGGIMGKDQFLKLLIAQLKNQDPMSPLQGDQMASQLAQFSSLEQLQQINANLTGQQTQSGTLLGAVQSSAAINTIGHTVVAIGNQLQVGGANARPVSRRRLDRPRRKPRSTSSMRAARKSGRSRWDPWALESRRSTSAR
jgi:flagellar basal-body rod modification protein FlgD